MQQQPSAQGIASLYMGNPGALQQRVQKEQQAKPGLPPDLGKLMALNIVTNEQDAAKRQQALSAVQQAMGPTGQMPTVAQSLEAQAKQKIQAQMLQQQRQQMAMQEMAKRGGLAGGIPENVSQPERQPQGIDELPVEMEFCGGGIVAFAEGDEVGYETPYDRMTRENRERAARELEERVAQIRASGNEAGATTAGAGEALRALGAGIDRLVPDPVQLFRRLVSDPSLAKEPAPAQLPQASYSNEDRRAAGLAAAAPAPAPSAAPRAAPTPASARAQGITAVAPIPVAGRVPAGSDLSALLEQGIRADLGRDREAEAQRMSEQYAKTAGYDQAVKQLQDILGGRQKAIEEAKAGRTPEWVKGLQALGGAPVRGGLGMMLGQAGAAATKAREAYGDEDMKFTQELDKLREGIVKAQLEGNAAKAKTYMDAYKEVDAARRSALTSGTSLENTREAAAARRQVAAEAAAGRAEARSDKTESDMRQRAMALAMAAAQKEKALPANMVKYKDVSTEQLAATMFERIYNALKTGKMVEAPGAASPGGTMSGWGKAQVVK